MDHKTATELLVKIEDHVDVNMLLYHGVRVWPVLRLQIWKELLRQSLPFGEKEEKQAAQIPMTRIKRFSAWNRLRHLLAEQIQWRALAKYQSEFLFFSNPKHYRFELEGKPYNYLLDPWIQFIQSDYRCRKVEISGGESGLTQSRFVSSLLLNEYLHASTSASAGIDCLPELNKALDELGLSIYLAEDKLVPILNIMESRTIYYKKILLCVRPKVVCLVNYYDEKNLPLVRACRNLGIKIVDIQHGKQGKYHGMYNHWTRIPENGYEFLPDFFWVWGEESRTNILRGRSVGTFHHMPLVGGNLWLLKWKNSGWYVESEEERQFGNRLLKKDKVILFSAQPIGQPIPGQVLDAMKKSPPGWLWLIRLHPAQIANEEKIADFLSEAGVSQFEIEQATRLPLYPLLKKSHYHITCWSTVCYEALVFDVPTSIVHENGKVLYQDYISNGLFLYADSGIDLLNQIEQCKNRELPAESLPYIVADGATAEKAFHAILYS